MNQRPARISGWVQITGRKTPPGDTPQLGGVVDVSRTGAKVYLSWKVKEGDLLPLALTMPDGGGRESMPAKVVRVSKDQPGNMENFEARLRLLKDLVHAGSSKGGMFYGYACGVKWEPSTPKECIRAIQKHFEEENTKPVKRVFVTHHPDFASAAPPSLRPTT